MDGSRGRLTRRQLMSGLGVVGAALLVGCGNLLARPQPPPKVARIGWLSGGVVPDSASLATFRAALQELGLNEGQHYTIEFRTTEGQAARTPELAAELVQLPVDILAAGGGPLIPGALRDATSTIPIVAFFPSDPVAAGFAASLARPGGNMTGVTQQTRELTGKRLSLLKDTLPSPRAWPTSLI